MSLLIFRRLFLDSKWTAELVLTSVLHFNRATTIVLFPANSTVTTSHFHSYSYSLRFGPNDRRDRGPSASVHPLQPCNLGFDFTIIYVSIFLPSGMTKQAGGQRGREGGRAGLCLSARCRSVLSIGLYCPVVRVPSLPYRSLSILSCIFC